MEGQKGGDLDGRGQRQIPGRAQHSPMFRAGLLLASSRWKLGDKTGLFPTWRTAPVLNPLG